jgi:NIMA (never in mitosis gene a)-related kinase 7
MYFQELEHPNIIRYMGSFLEENSDLIIVLELAGAGDLAQLLSVCKHRQSLLAERTLWHFFTQICCAVNHVHSKRIVHRDIKPANVFLTDQCPPVLKLGDLGLGRFFSCSTVAAHSLVGTPYYMSPERLRQHGYDFSSDIWSLGCLLYEVSALIHSFPYLKFHSLKIPVGLHLNFVMARNVSNMQITANVGQQEHCG